MVSKLLKCVPCIRGQNACSYLFLQTSAHHRDCQGQKLVCGSNSLLSLNAQKRICSGSCLQDIPAELVQCTLAFILNITKIKRHKCVSKAGQS